MPATTDPNLGLHYGFAYRESGWGDAYNADLKKLGAVVQLAVASRTASQPDAPAEGDRYIVPAGATGTDWAGQDDTIALYQDSAWRFYPPATGWSAYIADETQRYDYDRGWQPGNRSAAEIKTAYESNADTNALTDAEQTKLAYLAVTQQTDLDNLAARVDALNAAVVLKGDWDAATGAFPTGADTGDSYIVSGPGTVDGVAFKPNDRIVALTDSAPTDTYADSWLKLDYTDQVLSVAGRTGAVTLAAADIADLGTAATTDASAFATAAQGDTADSAVQPGDAINATTLAGDGPGAYHDARQLTNTGTAADTVPTNANLGSFAYQNFAAAPFINRLSDSGRFDGGAGGLNNRTNGAFDFGNFFSLRSGSTVASAGKFIYGNSTFGGNGEPLTETVEDLRVAMGAGGYQSAYGVEFYVAEVTAGSESNSPVTIDGQTFTRVLTNTGKAIFASAGYTTLTTWIRALGSSAYVADMSRYTSFVDGARFTDSNFVLTPPEGWRHIWIGAFNSRGYESAFPQIYSQSGQKVQLALPGVFTGYVDTGRHTSPLPSTDTI